MKGGVFSQIKTSIFPGKYSKLFKFTDLMMDWEMLNSKLNKGIVHRSEGRPQHSSSETIISKMIDLTLMNRKLRKIN